MIRNEPESVTNLAQTRPSPRPAPSVAHSPVDVLAHGLRDGRIRTVELWPGRRAEDGVIGRALVREAEASEAIATERGLVGSGMFEPFSYLTLTSTMRDEYRRVPEPPTEAVTYTLFALIPDPRYLFHCVRLWTHVSTHCFSLPST